MLNNEILLLVFICVIILILVTVPKIGYIPVLGASVVSLLHIFSNKTKENLSDPEQPSKLKTVEVLDITPGNTDGELRIVSEPTNDLDNSDLIDEIFSESQNAIKPSDGDSRIAERLQYSQEQSRDAILHRARMTSDSSRKHFEEELDHNENRHWWENDDYDMEMIKDGEDWSKY